MQPQRGDKNFYAYCHQKGDTTQWKWTRTKWMASNKWTAGEQQCWNKAPSHFLTNTRRRSLKFTSKHRRSWPLCFVLVVERRWSHGSMLVCFWMSHFSESLAISGSSVPGCCSRETDKSGRNARLSQLHGRKWFTRRQNTPWTLPV